MNENYRGLLRYGSIILTLAFVISLFLSVPYLNGDLKFSVEHRVIEYEYNGERYEMIEVGDSNLGDIEISRNKVITPSGEERLEEARLRVISTQNGEELPPKTYYLGKEFFLLNKLYIGIYVVSILIASLILLYYDKRQLAKQ